MTDNNPLRTLLIDLCATVEASLILGGAVDPKQLAALASQASYLLKTDKRLT